MPYCGEHTKVKVGPDCQQLASLKCRAWTCPDCQDTRRRGLVADAIRGQPNTFVTLTLPASWAAKAEEGVKLLSNSWRLFRKRFARKFPGQKLPFLAVVERTKAGTPHLHILCRSKWISKALLSATMAELAQAPIVDVARIRDRAQVAGYCAKYVGKNPDKVGSCKRYWQSRDYSLSPRPPAPAMPAGWHRGERYVKPLVEMVRQFLDAGWRAELQDDGSWIVYEPPPLPGPAVWTRGTRT